MAEGRDDLNHELMLLELQGDMAAIQRSGSSRSGPSGLYSVTAKFLNDIRTPRMIEVLPQTEGRDNRAFDPSTQRLHTGRGQGQDTQPMSVINAGNEEPSTVPKIKTTELMIVRPKTTRKICKPIKEQSEISEADAKRADNARRTNDIGVRLVEDESEDNNNGNSSKKYALMNHFLNAAGYSDPEKIDLTGNDKDMILDFPVDVYRKKRKRTIIAVISVFGALICIGAIQVTILAALGHIKIRPDNSTKIIIEPPKTVARFKLRFTIENQIFSRALTNSSSPDYIHLASSIQNGVDKMYSNSTIAHSYGKSTMISFSSGSVIVTMKLYLKTTVNWKNVTEVVDVPTTFMTEVFTENIHRFLPDYTISTDSVSITVQVLPISATLVPYMRCKHPRYLGDLIVQACLNTFYQLKVSSGSCSQLSKLITCMQKPSGCTSSHILHFLSSYVSQTWISKTMNFRPVVSKCYRVNETLQTGICPDQMSLDSLDKSAPHCFSDGRVTDCGDELARTRCLRQELNCSTSSIADALLNATSCNDTCLNLLSNSSRLIEDMKSICPYQYSWLTDGWKNNTPEINCRHRRLLQLCGHLNDRNCFNRSNNQSELLTQTLIDLNDDYSVSEFDDDLSCQTGANKSSSFSEYWLKWDTWNTCQSYLSECKRALNQSQISAACMCLEKKFIPCVVWANDDFYYGWSSDSVSVGFKSLFERFVNDVDVVRITGFSAKCLASGPHKSTTETAITTTKKNTFQKV